MFLFLKTGHFQIYLYKKLVIFKYIVILQGVWDDHHTRPGVSYRLCQRSKEGDHTWVLVYNLFCSQCSEVKHNFFWQNIQHSGQTLKKEENTN